MRREAKLIKIGKSQGIRIPKTLILRYHLGDSLILEEKEEGILVRTKDPDQLDGKKPTRKCSKLKQVSGTTGKI